MKYLLSILCLLSFCLGEFRIGFDISSNINVKQDELIMPLSHPSLQLEKPKSSKNLIIAYDKYFKIPLGIGIESCISTKTIYLGLPSQFKKQRAANYSAYIFYYTPKYKKLQGFIRYGISMISNYSDNFTPYILDNGFVVYNFNTRPGPMYSFGISIDKFQISYSSYNNEANIMVNDKFEFYGPFETTKINYKINKVQLSYLIK